MELIDAIHISKRLWKWLYNNPGSYKNEWPDWDINGGDVEVCGNWCPICKYVVDMPEELRLDKGIVFDCRLCPIKWTNDDQSSINETWCEMPGSPYLTWQDADNEEEDKAGALGVLKKLEEAERRYFKDD